MKTMSCSKIYMGNYSRQEHYYFSEYLCKDPTISS